MRVVAFCGTCLQLCRWLVDATVRLFCMFRSASCQNVSLVLPLNTDSYVPSDCLPHKQSHECVLRFHGMTNLENILCQSTPVHNNLKDRSSPNGSSKHRLLTSFIQDACGEATPPPLFPEGKCFIRAPPSIGRIFRVLFEMIFSSFLEPPLFVFLLKGCSL